MTHFLAKAGLAALLAIGGLTATAPMAAAGGPDVDIYFGFGDSGPRYRDRDDSGWRHRAPWERGYDRPRHRPGCAPWQAIDQARYFGLRRAEIADINRRRVIVEGRGRYGWGRMVFANAPGCPLISR